MRVSQSWLHEFDGVGVRVKDTALSKCISQLKRLRVVSLTKKKSSQSDENSCFFYIFHQVIARKGGKRVRPSTANIIKFWYTEVTLRCTSNPVEGQLTSLGRAGHPGGAVSLIIQTILCTSILPCTNRYDCQGTSPTCGPLVDTACVRIS